MCTSEEAGSATDLHHLLSVRACSLPEIFTVRRRFFSRNGKPGFPPLRVALFRFARDPAAGGQITRQKAKVRDSGSAKCAKRPPHSAVLADKEALLSTAHIVNATAVARFPLVARCVVARHQIFSAAR